MVATRAFVSATWMACLFSLCFSCVASHPSVLHAVEPHHHSLHAPLEKLPTHWTIGGSAVVERPFVRLTPSSPDHSGWLWNEHPLEAIHWEVEFRTKISSESRLGGEGLCMWVLSGDHDPNICNNEEAFSGPLFGLIRSFEGFGMCIDVYDNDGHRNNPSVFILENPTEISLPFNPSNDYEYNMVRTSPDPWDLDDSLDFRYISHWCVADIRNSQQEVKFLVKFIHKNVYVYIDSLDGMGYKFCLVVKLEHTYVGYHLAFTAATGQVADNHDILEVSMRYLVESTEQEVTLAESKAIHESAFHGEL